jgi:hypothetical protein
MQIVSNWRALVRRAWSVRFIALALGLEFASAVVPYFEVPRILTVLAIAGGLVARFIDQKIDNPPEDEPPLGVGA